MKHRFTLESRTIERLHASNGGATYSLISGSALGKPGYAIAIRVMAVVPGRSISSHLLRQLMRRWRQVLFQPDVLLGTWYNPGRQESWIEIVEIVLELDQAIRLARCYGEQSIFDLATGKTIAVDSIFLPADPDPSLLISAAI